MSSEPTTNTENLRFPQNILQKIEIILGRDGNAYFDLKETKNHEAVLVRSRKGRNIIRNLGHKEGVMLRKSDINDIVDLLQAYADTPGVYKDVWYRVASIPGGIEIDLGDEKHTRVRITAGKVEIVAEGSETLFFRTPVSRPMAMPAERGDLGPLRKYLNLHSVDQVLLIAWISYTLAHPKTKATSFVILVLLGGQGSGKTWLSDNVILPLIDPNLVGVQLLPTNSKDLAIAGNHSHVLAYDNVRGFRQQMADVMCIASTGGAMTARQLYTDADQYVQRLHVALVLNGIHSFINQPDLSQRCLPVRLKELDECDRKSESAIASELQADLPVIMRGLFDLIARIMKNLPTAEVTNPERMIDFVQWLAAMEKVDNAPTGAYQEAYSEALRQVQRESLLDNPLAAAVIELIEQEGDYSGTPAELLKKLNWNASPGIQRSRQWPSNAIALSKRLQPLHGGLKSQGIEVEFDRGQYRKITITKLEGSNDE